MSVAPKRSLFTRPAWAAKTSPSEEKKQETVFGRHADFDEVLEVERRRQLKREAEKKQKRDTPDKDAKKQNKKQPAEPDRKKRRISKEDPETSSESGNRSGSTSEHTSPDHASESEKEQPESERVTRSTPKKDKVLLDGIESQAKASGSSSPLKPRKVQVVEIADDDDDFSISEAPPKRQSGTLSGSSKTANDSAFAQNKEVQTKQDTDSESEDDEYTRALKQRARERARQQETSKSSLPTSQKDARSPSADQSQATPSAKSPSADPDPSGPFSQPKQADPYVVILIQSSIPNTKPLLVNRKASQGLQEVKDYWCGRENFPKEFASKVFLTWRDTRLFNSSTMRTILRQLKKETGFDPEGGDDPSQGKIVVEATTQELYDKKMAAKARKAAGEPDAGDTQSGPDSTAAEAAAAPPKREGIVLKLTCQGYEPMPLRVRPNTSVDKIMRAFQSQRGVDKSKRCWLQLDGETLEPEMSVAELELEDGDMIEVTPR
jgi:hypothetical protein